MPLCDELPMGNAAHTAPPNQNSVFTVFTVSAARRSTANRRCHAEFECKKNYRRVRQRAKLPLGNAWQLDGNGGMQSAGA